MWLTISLLTLLFFASLLMCYKVAKNPDLVNVRLRAAYASIVVATVDIVVLLTYIFRSLL